MTPTPSSPASLFTPLTQRSLRLRNRIAVPPMCQYSAENGMAADWHLAHYGALAAGGAGAVIVEATAVVPEGRISPADLGLWSDAHGEALARVAHFVTAQGAAAGVQLAHAGRKASTAAPWNGSVPLQPANGGWPVVGATEVAWADGYPVPQALDEDGIARVIEAFRLAARRARAAGFQLAEVHGAHGYLVHQFLSPLVNTRTDRWGGSFENRTRLALEITKAVRSEWPDELPVWVRLSATDWADGGWDADQTVALARQLQDAGADLIDVSTGGVVSWQKPVVSPGYQVPFAERVRHEAGVPTGAVGLITEPAQANAILLAGRSDVVLVGRESLRDPHWPLRAAKALGAEAVWPRQYLRARI
jgi:2,4-dienoyl-CoA reductase-like NADH-dependent reductase (Old Yellow Enzyme family)